MNKIKKKVQTCEPEWPSVREPQQKKGLGAQVLQLRLARGILQKMMDDPDFCYKKKITGEV